MEIKIVNGFNNRYSVSASGNVYSMVKRKEGVQATPVKELKPSNNKGYLRVALRREHWNDPLTSKYVHRLVAEAFLPNPNGYEEVNHIDGNKMNNHVSNLEWCSHAQNITHAWETGLSTVEMLKEHSVKVFTGTHIVTGEVISLIGQKQLKEAGFTKSSVYHCVNGTRGPHKKFMWSISNYKDN